MITVIGIENTKAYLDKLRAQIGKEQVDAIKKATLIAEREVKLGIKDTFGGRGGVWRASWTSAVGVAGPRVYGVVGSPHPASRIQEEGGTIHARNATYLTIPLTRKARRKPIREWEGGFFFRSKKDVLLFARKLAGARAGKIELLFALKPSVRLKPTHYLSRAMKKAEPKIIALVGTAVEVAIRGGKR